MEEWESASVEPLSASPMVTKSNVYSATPSSRVYGVSPSPLTMMAGLVSGKNEGSSEPRHETVYVLRQPFLGVQWIDIQRVR